MKLTYLKLTYLALGIGMLAVCANRGWAAATETLLLQQPTIHGDAVAFVYDEQLWFARRSDAVARRITSGPGAKSVPRFSPDGRWIAFTANYDGNLDVYVIPAQGGEPKRLTWHPADDEVNGWTPDGKVIFASGRSAHVQAISPISHLYTIGLEGGYPEKLPVPNGRKAALSAQGRLAFQPTGEAHKQWKGYRGGTHSRIWLMDMNTLDVEEIPQPAGGANDTDALWIGEQVYFLSDREGEFNLYRFDPASGKVSRETHFEEFPVQEAAADGRRIIFQQAGALYTYDTESAELARLSLQVLADLRQTRTRYVSAKEFIDSAHPHPGGDSVLLGYRGEVLLLTKEPGVYTNLSRSPGSRERFPVFSPQGDRAAYFSDEGGDYALVIQSIDAVNGEKKSYALTGSGFYFNPVWSPDGRYISYLDNSHSLYIFDLRKQRNTKIATEIEYEPFPPSTAHAWSPDSRGLAYTLKHEGMMQTLYLYSLSTGESLRITDGVVEASQPVFDSGGRYLYFLGSTDAGPTKDWFSQSNLGRYATQRLFVAVLDRSLPSPFAKGRKSERKEGEAPAPIPRDLEGLVDRIASVPLPAAVRSELKAGRPGEVLFLENPNPLAKEPCLELFSYSLFEKEAKRLAQAVESYQVAAGGEFILLKSGDAHYLGKVDKALVTEENRVPVDSVEVRIEPRAEWSQMLDESWRMNRDFFYATNYHGVDWPAIREKYRSLLPHAATRNDVGRLITGMLSELGVGHSFYWGEPPFAEAKKVPVGLLAADFEVTAGRYRFKKIYPGSKWDEGIVSPLRMPGVSVAEGEFLLAVDGRPLSGKDNIFSFFENKVGRPTVLTVSQKASGAQSRQVTVEPIDSELAIRYRSWVEGNRAYVEAKTGGKVAYVHLPDTADEGFAEFRRYYFPQVEKRGIILDERFNGGGYFADYYLDYIRRTQLAHWVTRYGRPIKSSKAAIDGPAVMLIEENAGSGGDLLPWLFRQYRLGTLIGKRTWGGLVGMLDDTTLMDGGVITVPNFAFMVDGDWAVENEGVAPDIEVEQWPKAMAAGGDPQLDAAIEHILKQLAERPEVQTVVPPFPVRHGAM